MKFLTSLRFGLMWIVVIDSVERHKLPNYQQNVLMIDINMCKPLKRPMVFFHLVGTTRGGFFAFIFKMKGTHFLPWGSCMDRWPGAWLAHGGGWGWRTGKMVYMGAGNGLLRKRGTGREGSGRRKKREDMKKSTLFNVFKVWGSCVNWWMV